MKKRYKSLAVLTALLCLMTAGCAAQTPAEAPPQAEESSAAETQTTAPTAEPDASGGDADWDENAVRLQFDGDAVTPAQAEGVSAEGSVVTIRKGGAYVLSGTLTDGRVIVSLADKTEKVQLIFNGVSITSSTSAPLTVLQADKTVITLADGTENALTDAASYTEFDIEESDGSTYPNACLASKDDLTIKGGGALTVSGSYNNGIHCADDLKILGGVISVTAENHGIRGNDSVTVRGGTVTVTAGGDGIKSSTADKDGKGYVSIEGGTVSVTAQQDGIDAAAALTITDGTLDITAGGGAENAPARQNGMQGGFGGGMGGFGGPRGWFGGDDTAQPMANYQLAAAAADGTGSSTKGIKSDGALTISGGAVTINSADDGVHSDSTIAISGVVLQIASGDDGIHADESVTVSGGDINITQSYEGIEAAEISVTDGTIHLCASDDGFNASDGSGGGMGFNRGGSGELNISGGYIFVNADGDGLDSNGNITMTGGTVIVCGPTSSADGALDSGDNNNTITVTGGTLLALGSVGMMETPEANYIAAANLNAAAGTLIVAADADGRVLAAFETPKQAQGIVFSAEGMSDGYYIYTGGDYSGTLNDDGFASGGSYTGGTLVTSGSGGGAGGGFGGMPGGGGFGGRGGRGGNMTPPEGFDENMTPPDGFGSGDMTPPDGFGKAPF